MSRAIHTDAAPPPASRYAQAIETPPGARLLHVSGQVGTRPDGTLAGDADAQHEQVWRNILAILDAAGMEPTDIVELVGIVTDPSGVPLFRAWRERMLGDHLAASTLLICGLADPAWQVEIAVRAARAD